jgi:hypothetical protein
MAKRPYERPVITKQFSGLMNKFGSAPVSTPKTEIDDVRIKDLTEKFGSPLFVLSERTIRENQRSALRVFRSRYPRVQFAWSYKTNYLNNVDLFFFGPAYTYVNVRGYKTLQCHQVGLHGEWIIDPAFSVSVAPLYTTLTDGRSLVSATAGMKYSPVEPLVLQVSGVWGKRAYYFNPDLLTVFNQDETQENLWSVRAEYTVGGIVTLIGSYQSTAFTGYTVKYLALGVRGRFEW